MTTTKPKKRKSTVPRILSLDDQLLQNTVIQNAKSPYAQKLPALVINTPPPLSAIVSKVKSPTVPVEPNWAKKRTRKELDDYYGRNEVSSSVNQPNSPLATTGRTKNTRTDRSDEADWTITSANTPKLTHVNTVYVSKRKSVDQTSMVPLRTSVTAAPGVISSATSLQIQTSNSPDHVIVRTPVTHTRSKSAMELVSSHVSREDSDIEEKSAKKPKKKSQRGKTKTAVSKKEKKIKSVGSSISATNSELSESHSMLSFNSHILSNRSDQFQLSPTNRSSPLHHIAPYISSVAKSPSFTAEPSEPIVPITPKIIREESSNILVSPPVLVTPQRPISPREEKKTVLEEVKQQKAEQKSEISKPKSKKEKDKTPEKSTEQLEREKTIAANENILLEELDHKQKTPQTPSSIPPSLPPIIPPQLPTPIHQITQPATPTSLSSPKTGPLELSQDTIHKTSCLSVFNSDPKTTHIRANQAANTHGKPTNGMVMKTIKEGVQIDGTTSAGQIVAWLDKVRPKEHHHIVVIYSDNRTQKHQLLVPLLSSYSSLFCFCPSLTTKPIDHSQPGSDFYTSVSTALFSSLVAGGNLFEHSTIAPLPPRQNSPQYAMKGGMGMSGQGMGGVGGWGGASWMGQGGMGGQSMPSTPTSQFSGFGGMTLQQPFFASPQMMSPQTSSTSLPPIPPLQPAMPLPGSVGGVSFGSSFIDLGSVVLLQQKLCLIDADRTALGQIRGNKALRPVFVCVGRAGGEGGGEWDVVVSGSESDGGVSVLMSKLSGFGLVRFGGGREREGEGGKGKEKTGKKKGG
ncbi:hypothetical protein BLNAU_19604 [Blattamonas nauphoetae]|uniref:Uncharacterized protein n=1 Tax=Blattamonas nauphoetae TaxID=2049346 RepID=A0ABQ9X578_9EUKA|nr:hypothetical protein BLNAU_19604 [Blattamonas nauphoetae]